jgi:hypothetical protein
VWCVEVVSIHPISNPNPVYSHIHLNRDSMFVHALCITSARGDVCHGSLYLCGFGKFIFQGL